MHEVGPQNYRLQVVNSQKNDTKKMAAELEQILPWTPWGVMLQDLPIIPPNHWTIQPLSAMLLGKLRKMVLPNNAGPLRIPDRDLYPEVPTR